MHTPCPCPHCGKDTTAPALSRVTLHRKPWGNSPALWLGGDLSALEELRVLGYTVRTAAGWYIPTAAFPA